MIRKGVERRLPAGYDVETHFEPSYDPWDQRLCLVPDNDLFKAISAGRASMVTDAVETFTETGIRLASGHELDADLIVTATGLNMQVLGGIELVVDGREIHLPDAVAYKGLMLSGVPNMAFAVGYTNASWTLKCDLTCEYVCRVLNHMDERGYRKVAPRLPDHPIPTQPLIDLKSGYVLRAIDRFPKQGVKLPWRLYQSYPRDIRLLRHGPLEDGVLEFSHVAQAAEPVERAAA
jgi:cation diffusion facilitator CzcD-associated flavoprotein CzcO